MKKLASLLLALVMIMSCFSAMAEATEPTTYTITINNTYATTGHTYEAYQIFKGTLFEGEDKIVLSDIEWGSGVVEATLMSALQDDPDFAGVKSAADVADKLSGQAKDSDLAKKFAAIVGANLSATTSGTFTTEGGYKISGLEAGYYLVKDKDESVNGNDSYTRFILEVVDNVTVNPKGNVPSVDKQITNTGAIDKEGKPVTESGDFNIGDTIEYSLIGTLPSNYADYTVYKYVFTDTLTVGLTYNDDAKVYVVNGDTETEVTEEDGFDIAYANNVLTVTNNNLKAITDPTISASSKIVVKYTCILNANAVIGGEGNPNTVDLIFSNDPNYTGEGENSPTGDTPDDTVVVFTFELDVTKIDGTDKTTTLEGAQFKLKNSEDKWVTVDADGKVTGWDAEEDNASVLTSNADGLFKVIGLEDGVYTMKETKAPDGYNLLADEITITITSTYDEDGVKTLTILVGSESDDNKPKDGDTSNGKVEMNVENKKGATLPETGGMGTTILYVGGGILVLAAIVLLIVKRRASAE